MILFLQATMQGLALGAVYSLVAIGLVLIKLPFLSLKRQFTAPIFLA